jgi:hypothetical protein
MTGNMEERELKDRLNLIESMIAEGRRSTESWGWTFVLWGAAYYIAIAWSIWGRASLAWPVTMTIAFVTTGLVASRMGRNRPVRTLTRAIISVWIATGISLFVVMMSLGLSGRADPHTSVAVVGSMLGLANATSSMILKWKLQLACAVFWWGAAVAACFGSNAQTSVVFLVAIFFGQIVFGIYCMIREAQKRKLETAHA